MIASNIQTRTGEERQGVDIFQALTPGLVGQWGLTDIKECHPSSQAEDGQEGHLFFFFLVIVLESVIPFYFCEPLCGRRLSLQSPLVWLGNCCLHTQMGRGSLDSRSFSNLKVCFEGPCSGYQRTMGFSYQSLRKREIKDIAC